MPKSRKATSRAKHARKAKATMKRPTKKVQKRGMSERAKKVAAEARHVLKVKAQKKAFKEQVKQAAAVAENERLRVEDLLANGVFAEFISKNIGKKAINIIKLLNSPQTDEKLAADLSVKINEVRRILNVLDSYGVARYDTNKDSKGWLTFKWYLDCEKLSELHRNALTAKPESAYNLPDNCNDFFYCGKCYEEQKVILPFDAAFEGAFKCDNCGRQLKQLNKDEAIAMFEESVAEKEGNVVPA